MDQRNRSSGPAPLAAAALLVGLLVAMALSGCGGGGPDRATPHASAQPPVEVGGTPVAIAAGEGGVWVVDNTGGSVVQLDPRNGRRARSPIQVGRGPGAIAVGEGYVWVVSGDDTVTRIDPVTGRAKLAPVHVADPAGIAAGEGSVWVTSRAGGTVTRIDPRTLRAVGTPIRVGSEPADVAVDAGAAWVANAADGTVTRIDATSGEPGDPIVIADEQVLGLSVGEGGVWVAKSDDRLSRRIEVVRIDPGSSQVEDGAAEVAAAIPVELAAGEAGVWVTLVGGVRPPDLEARPGRVALVDPATGDEVGTPLRVGDRPSGIAVGEGAVWVADSGDGTVARIDPGT